jgi:hypothetical protein
MLKKTIDINELKKEKGGTLKDFKDHTDPKYIGPGTWNIMHRYAFKSRTSVEQKTFINFMKELCSGFPCEVCRGHCKEYIMNNPMESYVDKTINVDGENIVLGLFIWTWKFHNAVNARLKKSVMSWDTAYNLYSDNDSLVCSSSCSESEKITK